MPVRPIVSIITVVYNDSDALEQTIKSVIQQEYESLQYIVIDGGSNDSTLQVIEKYREHISNLTSESDSGIYDAMNKGIEYATGDWVMFLNAGDIFSHSNVLRDIFIQDPDEKKKMIVGSCVLTSKNFEKELIPKSFTPLNLILWGTRVINHQSLFIRQDVLTPYNLSYKLKAELDWYFELSKVISPDEVLSVNYPVVKYQLGGRGEQRLFLNLREHLQVLISQKGMIGLLGVPVLVFKFFRTKFFH